MNIPRLFKQYISLVEEIKKNKDLDLLIERNKVKILMEHEYIKRFESLKKNENHKNHTNTKGVRGVTTK